VIENHNVADAGAITTTFLRHGPFDVIVHLAAQVAVTTSRANPDLDFRTNAVGTLNLLEATRLYSSESVFIYASTNKVYGELEQVRLEEREKRYVAPEFPEGLDESLPLSFATPYACSKGSADQYVLDWHRTFGLFTVVFRHSSMYGRRQWSSFDQGWVDWICRKAIGQQAALRQGCRLSPVTIAGNGKQVRDVLHVSDVVRLYDAAWEHGRRYAGTAFNIGGGMSNSLSLLELVELLESKLDIKLSVEFTDWRPSDQRLFVANPQLARTCLGWVPSITAANGIEDQVNWLMDSEKMVDEKGEI
jgi:CDP-paratose 2-epimerase